MTKKHEIEFANFILRFGQNNFFVDLFEQIVFPAFTDNKLVRDTGEAQFFFRNVSLHNFGDDNNPIIALVGRYIKNTILQREQFFDEESNQVIPDRRSIDSSPSAVFVIILNHHRLMYYGETKNSPSLNSFEATLKKFIRETYDNFVNALYEQNETQYTKKFLRDEYFPSLDIVFLTRERSIEDFINQYGLLTRVEIDLLTPNQEIDNNDFFRQARLKKEEAQSKKMAIVHSNHKEGLSLGGITRQVNSALNQGNSKVNLSGKDRQGNKLEGTNELFKIKSQLSEPPLTFEGIVTRCYQSLENLIQEGSIVIPERAENISEKIKQIWNNRNNFNE